VLKKKGEFSQAQQRFIALSEQHPNLSGIWLQLALLAKQQNKDDIEQRHKDMSRYLNNAISANALNYLAHNELALVLRQQGQFKQALNHYELAIKSWPAFALGYLNRGILYDLYMGDKSLALSDYELYQALSNDNSRQLKGWIIDLQRQLKNALQATQTGAIL
jgi:tetratricopeptide (TPR) repeat protein